MSSGLGDTLVIPPTSSQLNGKVQGVTKNFLIYIFSFVAMSAQLNPFIHITEPIERAFLVTKGDIIYIGVGMGFTLIFLNPFVPSIFAKINLRWVQLIASAILLATSALRLTVKGHFGIFFLTSFVNGVTAAFIYGSQMMFVKTWFRTKDFASAYTVLNVVQIFGGAVFAMSPFLFINEHEPSSQVLIDQTFRYVFFLFLFPLAYFLLVAIFFDAEPKVSVSAEDRTVAAPEVNFSKEIGRALRTKSFQLLSWPYILTRLAVIIFSINCNLYFEAIKSLQLYGSLTYMTAMLLGVVGTELFKRLFPHRVSFGIRVFQTAIIFAAFLQIVSVEASSVTLLVVSSLVIGLLSINQASQVFALIQQKNTQLNVNVMNAIVLQIFTVLAIFANVLSSYLHDNFALGAQYNAFMVLVLFAVVMPFTAAI